MRQTKLVPLYLVLAIDLLIISAFIILAVTRRRRVQRRDGLDLFQQLIGTTSTNGDHQEHGQSDDSGAIHCDSDDVLSLRARVGADNYDGCVDETSLTSEPEAVTDPDLCRFLQSLTMAITSFSIGLSFSFRDLCVTIGDKTILQDVTGSVKKGTFFAVMGGSGAGKSTFMNVLTGKLRATAGLIAINGRLCDASHYKRLCGYVPQDDILLPELTVRENIMHAAKIRLPAKWTQEAVAAHVDSLLAYLQLAHVQHCRVGDARHPLISGGQRKRVNIGIELASSPMALFLDEPTSGLDSQSAAAIMRLLRAVSRLGITTFVVIHQPREQIFYLFDEILLLARGQTVYLGATEGAQPYFEDKGFIFPPKVNACDTLLDIVTGDGDIYASSIGTGANVPTLIKDWQAASTNEKACARFDGTRSQEIANDHYRSESEQLASLSPRLRARGASWITQLWYCFERSCCQQTQRVTSFVFEIGTSALAGVIIGLSAFASNGSLFVGLFKPPFTLLSTRVDYISTPQLALLSAMAIGLVSSPPGFWVFGEEQLLYFREAASGHSRSAYILAKILSTLPRIVLSSFHFTVFLDLLATPMIDFGRLYLAVVLYTWCIYGLASMVSVFIRRENGPLVAVLASLVISVFGGVAPTFDQAKEWHMAWLWRSSPGLYFTEAIFSENITPFDYLYNLDHAADNFGFTLRKYGRDIGVLFVIGVVYRLIAGISMLYHCKPRHGVFQRVRLFLRGCTRNLIEGDDEK